MNEKRTVVTIFNPPLYPRLPWVFSTILQYFQTDLNNNPHAFTILDSTQSVISKPLQNIMSPTNSPSMSKPSPEVATSNALPMREKSQAKFEAAVLARQADAEGWSEEKLTMALNDPATKKKPSTYTPETVKPEEQSKAKDVKQAEGLQKRQETIRIIRQAEMEGWSDEKLVAALRIRLSLRHELRARAQSL